jgi:poly(A) polymerase Pap1
MTTDWTKQAEEMVRTWTGVQQKVMESMMGMMGMTNANTTMPKDMWEKTINTWHDSMKSALETQVTWTQFMADSITANAGANKQISEMSQQAVDMVKRWSETQTKVLDTWLEEVKKTDPADMSKTLKPEEMLKSVQSWQEAGRKMMETQMELMRSFTTSPQDPPASSSKK